MPPFLFALALTGVVQGPLVQKVAPDFLGVDCDGREVSLKKLVAQGPVVLAFFPKAFTPGCTKEMAAFAKRHAEVERHGAHVIAISGDTSDRLRAFRDDLQAPFTFFADPKGKVMKLYNVKMPLLTFASRATFVIDTKMNIVHVSKGSDAVLVDSALEALSHLQPAPTTTAP